MLNWTDKINDVDDVLAEDINAIAHALNEAEGDISDIEDDVAGIRDDITGIQTDGTVPLDNSVTEEKLGAELAAKVNEGIHEIQRVQAVAPNALDVENHIHYVYEEYYPTNIDFLDEEPEEGFTCRVTFKHTGEYDSTMLAAGDVVTGDTGNLIRGAGRFDVLITVVDGTSYAYVERNVIASDFEQLKADVADLNEAVFGDMPKTWKDVQTIVRSGRAEEFFSVGDQFAANRVTSATAEVAGGGITGATVDSYTFKNMIGEAENKSYIFVYYGDYWYYHPDEVTPVKADLADYGITTTGTAAVGASIIITVTITTELFDVIGIDHDTPTDANYEHSLTLRRHYTYGTPYAFSIPQATWYIDDDTYPSGLAAGTYHFAMPNSTAYQFTLTEDVPVGGQVVLDVDSGTPTRAYTYESPSSTTAIDNVAVTTGSGGSDLGTLSQTAVTANTNSVDRARRGSNLYADSNIRTFINSSAPAGEWWTPTSVFSRPPTSNNVGYMRALDPAFLAVTGDVKKKTQLPAPEGRTLAATDERFFIPSRTEVFGTTEYSTNAEGEQYDYFKTAANRITYYNGTARQWWLRTPYSGDGYRMRSVTSAGAMDLKNANATYYFTPCVCIV